MNGEPAVLWYCVVRRNVSSQDGPTAVKAPWHRIGQASRIRGKLKHVLPGGGRLALLVPKRMSQQSPAAVQRASSVANQDLAGIVDWNR